MDEEFRHSPGNSVVAAPLFMIASRRRASIGIRSAAALAFR
jgi:hypothetical protein